MKKITIATSLLALAMSSGTLFPAHAQQPSMTQNDAATPEQQSAYNDGIMAAKLDKAAKRKIDPTSSHLYQHPPVKKDAHDTYRTNFKKGYEYVTRGM